MRWPIIPRLELVRKEASAGLLRVVGVRSSGGAGAVDEVVGVDDWRGRDAGDGGAEEEEERGLFGGDVGGEGYVGVVAAGAGEGREGYACGLVVWRVELEVTCAFVVRLG